MRKCKTLPQRVFNSPLVKYANFKDGSHVNLIRLHKPYANGVSWAIHQTTLSPLCYNALFKGFDEANVAFNKMVRNAMLESELVSSDFTGN